MVPDGYKLSYYKDVYHVLHTISRKPLLSVGGERSSFANEPAPKPARLLPIGGSNRLPELLGALWKARGLRGDTKNSSRDPEVYFGAALGNWELGLRMKPEEGCMLNMQSLRE